MTKQHAYNERDDVELLIEQADNDRAQRETARENKAANIGNRPATAHELHLLASTAKHKGWRVK